MRKDLTLTVFLANKKRWLLIAALINLLFVQAKAQTDSLDKMLGQMLMLGFRGTSITDTNQIVKDIQTLGIGGVILFEYDSPSSSRPRNIQSESQLQALTAALQKKASIPLFIGIDQEGGMVNRLKTRYGFPRSVDAQYLGSLGNPDTSRYYAQRTATTLANLGINVNFAPVLDVNINPACPVIGKIKRSFSDKPERVAQEAAIIYHAQQNEGIVSVYKHFPGHGSALADSHLGFTDVSQTWQQKELTPYKILLKQGLCDAVMTAHVFNSRLDSLWPGSLSNQTIDQLLRKQLGWQGVVFSDDMMMGAITDNYGLEEAIKHALLAGVDVLVFSNNIKTYDPAIASKAAACIKKLVNEGQIPWSVITNSYLRILKLKSKYHLL